MMEDGIEELQDARRGAGAYHHEPASHHNFFRPVIFAAVMVVGTHAEPVVVLILQERHTAHAGRAKRWVNRVLN